MRKLSLAVALAAAVVAVPAVAQDMAPADTTMSTTSTDEPARAPDGTRAFGIEPYVAVMGGWEGFDRRVGHGIPNTPIGGNKLDGAIVTGIVGVNVPLGPLFVGAEGEVTKGVDGDIDWGYGAAGRFGFRAGESGLFYGKVGYRWVNFDRFGKNSPDFDAITYGVGAENRPEGHRSGRHHRQFRHSFPHGSVDLRFGEQLPSAGRYRRSLLSDARAVNA